MKKRCQRNQKGYALLLIIMVVAVLMILGVELLSISYADAKNSIKQANQLKAHYIAQTGLDTTAKYIINNPTLITSALGNHSENMGDGNFSTNVAYKNNGDISSPIVITSKGTVGTNSETIKLELVPQKLTSAYFNNVVYSETKLSVNGNTTGPLQSRYDITVYDNKNKDATSSYKDPITPNTPMALPEVIFPIVPNKTLDKSTYTISDSGYYNAIDLNNKTLTFNTNDTILKVVVDSFSTKGDIKIVGGGTLYLYVKNTINLQTPNLINDSNPNSLVIFIGDGGDGTFNLQANMNFYGFIYGPKATVRMQSAQSKITGAIVCNEFDYGNKNTTLTYAQMGSNVLSGVDTESYKKSFYSND